MTTIAAAESNVPEEVQRGFSDRLGRGFASHDLRFATAALDALQTTGVGFATAQLLHGVNSVIDSGETAVIAITASVMAVALRIGLRATHRAGIGEGWTNGGAAARAAGLAVLMVGLEHRLSSTLRLPVGVLATWLLLWSSLAAINAYVLRAAVKRISSSITSPFHFFLFGDAEHTNSLAAVLAMMPGTGTNRIVRIDDRNPAEIAGMSVHPIRRDDIVLLVAETLDTVRIDDACRRLADFPGKVCLAMRAPSVGPLSRAFPRWGDYLLIDLVTDPHGGARGAIKRVSDIVLAGILLVLLSPMMLCAALLIRFETSGPVLFRQQRLGIGGRPIQVLKFRTMRADRCDATGREATTVRDPRVTTVGRILRRLSIDELPQLLNVLRGDMSLVGPRPHPVHMQVEGAYYQDIVGTYRVRHRVKPGITGWAQVNGSRGAVDTLEKAQRRVALDLWYMNHWSLLLDARILLLTALGGFASFSAD